MLKQFRSILICIALLTAAAPVRAARPVIIAGIPPVADLVRLVCGDACQATSLLASGQNPHFFHPTPRQVARLGAATRFFIVGLPFEKEISSHVTSRFPSVTTVSLIKNMKLLSMDGESHGHSGHADKDPHVWLDPKRTQRMVRIIQHELALLLPDHEKMLRARAETLKGQLNRLDQKIQQILAPVASRTMLVYHPTFGYFCDRYGLRQATIEKDGKPASGRHLAAITRLVKEKKLTTLFVQPRFSRSQATGIARILQLKTAVLDPLPHDYQQGLLAMARIISRGLAPR